MNKCVKCGTPVNEHQQFCAICGERVVHYENVVPTNQFTNPINPAGQKNKNNMLYIILALLIVLLIVSVVSFAVILNSRQNETVNDLGDPPVDYSQGYNGYNGYNGYSNGQTEYFNHQAEYFFPSDRELITVGQLEMLSKDEVALLRNEIYARHGYIFKSDAYQDYFSAKSWYYPNPYFDESMFNDIERINKETIVEYEKSKGWR